MFFKRDKMLFNENASEHFLTQLNSQMEKEVILCSEGHALLILSAQDKNIVIKLVKKTPKNKTKNIPQTNSLSVETIISHILFKIEV